MKNIDLAAKKCTDPQFLKSRPAHELNDKRVTLRAGAEARSLYQGGGSLRGGSDLTGYVWAAADGMAVCDFGRTASGVDLRVLAKVEDLEVHA